MIARSNNTATMYIDDIPDVQVSGLPHIMNVVASSLRSCRA